MNTDETTVQHERLWAFLHGELKHEARRTFEREAAEDPDLRERLEEARRLERALRVALRQPDQAAEDARLITTAADSWESDMRRGTRRNGQRKSWRDWMTFSLRAAAGVGSLAAALYLLLPTYRYSNTPTWTRPSFEPRLLRGSEKREPGVKAITRYDVKRCQIALTTALRTALAQRSAILPAGITFSMRVRELSNGALSVTVHATTGRRTAGDWTGQYAGVDAFLLQVDTSAENMIRDLMRNENGKDATRRGDP